MAMKAYSAFPKAPTLLELHYHMQFSIISRTLVRGLLPFCRDAVDVFYWPCRLDNRDLEIILILFMTPLTYTRWIWIMNIKLEKDQEIHCLIDQQRRYWGACRSAKGSPGGLEFVIIIKSLLQHDVSECLNSSLPIIHRPRLVFYVYTCLMQVSLCWLANTDRHRRVQETIRERR